MSGSIYAESACEFLVRHLIRTHSSLAERPPRASGGLPARRLRPVLEYVEQQLAQRIELRQLAELAGVSPRHFERAFRQALGLPPHAYVLHEIAARVGFSSASHLASVFRRHTGQSPAAFRRIEAG